MFDSSVFLRQNYFCIYLFPAIPPFSDHREGEFCGWEKFKNYVILSFHLSNKDWRG